MIRSVGSSPWRMTVAVVIFILVLGGYMSAAGIVFAQDVKISVFVGANGKVNDNADDFVDVVSSEEDYKLEIIADDDYVIGSVLVNDESLEKMNSEGESIIGFPKGTLHIEKPRGDLDVVVAFKKAGSDTGTSAGQQAGASAGSNSTAESGEGGSGNNDAAGGGSDGTGGNENAAGSEGAGESDNTAGTGDASGGNNDAAGGSDDTAATGEGNGDSAGSEGNGDSAGSDDAAGSTDAGDGNEDTGSNDSANGEVNRTTSNTGNTVVLRDVGKNKTDGSGDAAGNDATETADSGSGKAGNSYQSPRTGDEDGPQLPIVLTMMALAAGAMAVVRRRHA